LKRGRNTCAYFVRCIDNREKYFLFSLDQTSLNAYKTKQQVIRTLIYSETDSNKHMPINKPRVLITVGILVTIIGFILSGFELIFPCSAQNCSGGHVSHPYLPEGVLFILTGIILVTYGIVGAHEAQKHKIEDETLVDRGSLR